MKNTGRKVLAHAAVDLGHFYMSMVVEDVIRRVCDLCNS